MHTHTRTRAHTYAHAHACMHTHAHMHMHTCTRTHAHAHTHAHTHTHTLNSTSISLVITMCQLLLSMWGQGNEQNKPQTLPSWSLYSSRIQLRNYLFKKANCLACRRRKELRREIKQEKKMSVCVGASVASFPARCPLPPPVSV